MASAVLDSLAFPLTRKSQGLLAFPLTRKSLGSPAFPLTRKSLGSLASPLTRKSLGLAPGLRTPLSVRPRTTSRTAPTLLPALNLPDRFPPDRFPPHRSAPDGFEAEQPNSAVTLSEVNAHAGISSVSHPAVSHPAVNAVIHGNSHATGLHAGCTIETYVLVLFFIVLGMVI